MQGSAVRYAFGGKGGNQALAAGRLGRAVGVPVEFAGCIGQDEAGKDAVARLAAAGVGLGNLQRSNEPTGMSVAIGLPGGGYGAVIVSSANLAFAPERLALLPTLTHLVLQNELSAAVNVAAAQMARKAGAKIILNAAPARPINQGFRGLIDCLVVNRVEAAQILGVPVSSLEADRAARHLANAIAGLVVLTLGGEGLWLADAGHLSHLPAHPVTVRSTHGAGDAFVGALSVQLAAGAAALAACRFANAAAALHVSSAPDARDRITPDQVERLAAHTGAS